MIRPICLHTIFSGGSQRRTSAVAAASHCSFINHVNTCVTFGFYHLNWNESNHFVLLATIECWLSAAETSMYIISRRNIIIYVLRLRNCDDKWQSNQSSQTLSIGKRQSFNNFAQFKTRLFLNLQF